MLSEECHAVIGVAQGRRSLNAIIPRCLSETFMLGIKFYLRK